MTLVSAYSIHRAEESLLPIGMFLIEPEHRVGSIERQSECTLLGLVGITSHSTRRWVFIPRISQLRRRREHLLDAMAVPVVHSAVTKKQGGGGGMLDAVGRLIITIVMVMVEFNLLKNAIQRRLPDDGLQTLHRHTRSPS